MRFGGMGGMPGFGGFPGGMPNFAGLGRGAAMGQQAAAAARKSR